MKGAFKLHYGYQDPPSGVLGVAASHQATHVNVNGYVNPSQIVALLTLVQSFVLFSLSALQSISTSSKPNVFLNIYKNFSPILKSSSVVLAR